MAVARDQAARKVEVNQSGAGEQRAPASVEPIRARTSDEARPADAPAAEKATVAATPPSGRKRAILIGVGLVALSAAAYFGTNYYLVGRFMVGTDDAYVRANNSTLGSRVSGHVAQIVPADNTLVKAGDVVFRIDDGDYRIAVDSARAKIATQDATIARIGRQVTAQGAGVAQAEAQLTSAQAAATRSDLDYERQQALSTRGFASKAVFETSQASRDQSAAAVQAAKAAVESARDAVEVTKAQQDEARAQLAELKAALAKAERDLEFTQVRAPVDGIISNRIVNTGDYVNAGQRLANVVPLSEVFIDANFKETQLGRVKPGQAVKISVDAYDSRSIDGVVDSLSPAAGAVFTLLPPDNATGNFTKIVQRIPVRVRVPASVAAENLLRPGMSVYVKVDTREGVR